MRILLSILLFATLGSNAVAQRLSIESDTIEGQMLQQIDRETDAAKRMQMLEQFDKRFPNHEANTWVLAQIEADASKRGDLDRVFELSARILTLDPNDVSAAHYGLMAAEQRKNLELVKRWSTLASQIARRVLKSTQPEDADEVADWKARVAHAKQVDQYSEYSLYSAALNSKDTKAKSDLIEALENRNPRSEYLAYMRSAQTVISRQVDAEEAVRSAEASFAKGQYNIDELYMVAAYFMQKRQAPEKVIAYGTRLLTMLENEGKPAEMSDASWAQRRAMLLGQTNWMVGVLYSTQEKFAQADKYLRVSLNYIKDNEMVAGALYHLGYVNYRIAEGGERIRIHDAIKYTSECAKLPSLVQAQAAENLKSMRAEYAIPEQD